MQRCGSALRVLDLRMWIRLGIYVKAENLLCAQEVALLLPSLAAYSSRLTTLDLGFIPMDGQMLVGIANAVGGTLQVLRLGCCFQCHIIVNANFDFFVTIWKTFRTGCAGVHGTAVVGRRIHTVLYCVAGSVGIGH